MKKKNISYRDAIQYLYGLQKYGIKFGLSTTSNLLKAFGNPHHKQKYIHIAGTNGKGSVAVMLESILIKSGLKVGFYSSPHLVRFTERFRINGKEINIRDVAAITGELIKTIKPEEPPTFFEATTAMALIYFAREEVDIAIMETGMGGRLDATNVIMPLVSVITNISLEHQHFLGRRLVDIAGEKAGIIKKGVETVTAAIQPSVIRLIESVCKEKKAPFLRVGRKVRYRSSRTGFHYYGLERKIKGIKLGLKGGFQSRNAALALAVIEILEKKGYEISSTHITEGLEGAFWPGRMHIVSDRPLIILDGAHNLSAIRHLAGAIKGGFSYGRLILVIGIMEDKDIDGILRGIVPMADYIIYTRPDYYRAADPGDLTRAGSRLRKPGEIVPGITQALDKARKISNTEDLILVCGSLFTVGEAMSYFYPEEYSPEKV